MAPVRSPRPRAARDSTALVSLFVLLVLFAWHADRSRGVGVPEGLPTFAACATIEEDDERTACLEARIGERLASTERVGDVLAAVNAQARSDAWFSRRCHMIMHENGRRHDGALRPGDVAHDGKDCAAGFLHGWMMEHLGDLDRPTVDAWCGPARTTLEHADCEHGMGHVVVRYLEGDLRAALARCRELGDQSFLRNCASGAFMENRFGGMARDGAARTRYWRDGDPWLPCRMASPIDLLDACAAWAVRDLPSGRRVRWCAALDTVAGRAVDARQCLTAAGGTAPIEQSGAAACGRSTACWFGRGFAWAIVGWDHSDADEAALGCLEARGSALAACARGVGFRRAASIADDLKLAAPVACDHLFTGLALRACHDGAAQRNEPIAYA